MTSVNIPNSVSRIGDGAFFSCSSLKEIKLPNGLCEFGVSVFEASGLLNIEIPAGVKYLDGQVLNCEDLVWFSLLSNEVVELSGCYSVPTDCIIYVPAGLVDAYKASACWSNYASQIQAIPA